jgi:ankyrin repeat protein
MELRKEFEALKALMKEEALKEEAQKALMKEEALKAAGEGKIDELYRLIEKHSQLLDDFDKQFVHSPLHEAAKAGQTHFAIEVMNLKPSLARKLNPQGLSPLDLAVMEDHANETATGQEEEQSRAEKRERKNNTAKALIKLDKELIRVKGKKMMTPLHHAVMEDNVHLLAEFLCACPGSIGDLTNRSQTAVHLAVENHKLEIFNLLLVWLKRRHREDVLSWADEDGNNALHVAVQTGQDKVIFSSFLFLVLRIQLVCPSLKDFDHTPGYLNKL